MAKHTSIYVDNIEIKNFNSSYTILVKINIMSGEVLLIEIIGTDSHTGTMMVFDKNMKEQSNLFTAGKSIDSNYSDMLVDTNYVGPYQQQTI